jgi:hypothetical protein
MYNINTNTRNAEIVPNKTMTPEAQTGMWNAISALITTGGTAYAASQYKPPVYNQQQYTTVNASQTVSDTFKRITPLQWALVAFVGIALIVLGIIAVKKSSKK